MEEEDGEDHLGQQWYEATKDRTPKRIEMGWGGVEVEACVAGQKKHVFT